VPELTTSPSTVRAISLARRSSMSRSERGDPPVTKTPDEAL
jgi:hypothetical protein